MLFHAPEKEQWASGLPANECTKLLPLVIYLVLLWLLSAHLCHPCLGGRAPQAGLGPHSSDVTVRLPKTSPPPAGKGGRIPRAGFLSCHSPFWPCKDRREKPRTCWAEYPTLTDVKKCIPGGGGGGFLFPQREVMLEASGSSATTSPTVVRGCLEADADSVSRQASLLIELYFNSGVQGCFVILCF